VSICDEDWRGPYSISHCPFSYFPFPFPILPLSLEIGSLIGARLINRPLSKILEGPGPLGIGAPEAVHGNVLLMCHCCMFAGKSASYWHIDGHRRLSQEEPCWSWSGFYSCFSRLAVGYYRIRAWRQDFLHCRYLSNEEPKSDGVQWSHVGTRPHDRAFRCVIITYLLLCLYPLQIRVHFPSFVSELYRLLCNTWWFFFHFLVWGPIYKESYENHNFFVSFS